MAKRSANKYYKVISKSMYQYVQRADDMDIITTSGAIAIKASQNACQEILQLMGLMDFKGTLREDRRKEYIAEPFEASKFSCYMTPYFLKVGDHIAQIMACMETKTVIAVKYDYVKLINESDTVFITGQNRLHIVLSAEDDEWDDTVIIVAPITVGDLPEVQKIKEHLPGWNFV